jgi:hypothetical protein
MKSFRIVGVASLGLLLLAVPAQSGRVSYFVSSGVNATSDGFDSGFWGLNAGIEIPYSSVASFLVEGQYEVLPGTHKTVLTASEFFSNEDPNDATLVNGLVGLRLRSQGVVHTYLDGLAGVGRFHNRADQGPWTMEETNFILSFGAGARWSPASIGSLFVDAHAQFLYGTSNEYFPLRVGLSYP